MIYSLNLKKCSICSLAGVLLASVALAAPAGKITIELKRDLQAQKSTHFHDLIQKWHRQYGTDAVNSLIALAKDGNLPDHHRYIAMMGAAKIGGNQSLQLMKSISSEKSWMLKVALLRIYRMIHKVGQEEATDGVPLKLLKKDPALVVRNEAIKTVIETKPKGWTEALFFALEDPRNYHGGKAQWIPEKALKAMRDYRIPKAYAKRLLPLFQYKKDQKLIAATIQTLGAMTGKKLSKALNTEDKIEYWKRTLGP